MTARDDDQRSSYSLFFCRTMIEPIARSSFDVLPPRLLELCVRDARLYAEHHRAFVVVGERHEDAIGRREHAARFEHGLDAPARRRDVQAPQVEGGVRTELDAMRAGIELALFDPVAVVGRVRLSDRNSVDAT